jgi:uncharacterized protein YjbJ (UPF0337 family)
MDKAKGKAKEAAGAITGDEDKKAEAQEQATQKEQTRRAEKEAKEAEKERDRQERKDKGLLGGVSDSLSGRDRR